MADVKPEVKEEKKESITFEDGLRECSNLLVQAPNALDFGVKRTENGRHFYSFDNVTDEAKSVREKVTKILDEVYQNGAYSYHQFAEPLRVNSQSIQALLDEDFRTENNL